MCSLGLSTGSAHCFRDPADACKKTNRAYDSLSVSFLLDLVSWLPSSRLCLSGSRRTERDSKAGIGLQPEVTQSPWLHDWTPTNWTAFGTFTPSQLVLQSIHCSFRLSWLASNTRLKCNPRREVMPLVVADSGYERTASRFRLTVAQNRNIRRKKHGVMKRVFHLSSTTNFRLFLSA
jgi:hypothetical protein